MDIAIRVRNVEVPANLRRVTLERVTRLGRRCGIDRADVCFSERRNPRITEREVCQITLFGPRCILRAQAAAIDVAVAADRVVVKLERRADRLRGRVARCAGARSVHFPAGWSTVAMRPNAGDRIGGDAGEAADMGINDSRTEPMTPEEAAVAMCERGSDIFCFQNAETGRDAVVCCRADGAIALWDSPATAEVVT
jgi:putative sigma-54 modulation protein